VGNRNGIINSVKPQRKATLPFCPLGAIQDGIVAVIRFIESDITFSFIEGPIGD
jgi:hypothetical protein